MTVVCVGRIKERFYTEAVREYEKRLSRYAKLTIHEVKDEPTKEQPSEAERQMVLQREAERILPQLKRADFVIALAIDGRQYDSPGLAAYLDATITRGAGHIAFVIGGSYGLAEAVMKGADARLSFSELTFPHQLMRVILLEQLYRSFRILHGEPYHK